MLDGIDPDGLSEWTTLAGWVMGTALVLLMVAVAGGVALALWGKVLLSSRAIRRGWATVGVTAVGASIVASSAAAAQWGTSLGTSELMPAGARPQAVEVKKEAPKQSCTDMAVRDFTKEDPKPSEEEIKRVVKKVTDGQFEHDVVQTAVAPGDISVNSLKWYAAEGDDCSAKNESVEKGTEVKVEVTQVLNGADGKFRRSTKTEMFTVG